MNNMTKYLLLCAALILISGGNVHAARYALLVGVGNYPGAALEGPINDVNAIKKVLTEKWGFKKKNTRSLIDKEGTKKKILAEMRKLLKRSKKGDEIFLYFSGHGTSARDRALRFPLPTTSGAFIPYDVRDAKTANDIFKTLIVGKTDLKPILTALDQGGRHVFVAIDACYSGNAVRGIMKDKMARLPARYLDISTLLPERAFGDDLVNTGSEVWDSKNTVEDQSYPYKNVYYLSASGEHEQAKDIPKRLLDQIPTIDGKAHGAFTDTLLRILNQPSSADLNADGKVSYHEITKAVRKRMRNRGFDHTPNGLPSIAEDKGGLSTRGIFRNTNITLAKLDATGNKASSSAVSKKTVTEIKLKLKLGSGLSKWRKALGKLSHVKIVKQSADVIIRRSGKEIIFVSAAGDVITRSKKKDIKTISKMVSRQAWVKSLLSNSMRQDFNVYLEIYGNGKGSAAIKGENVGFSITSEKDAYLLLVDIDPGGNINVIYPYYDNELTLVKADKAFTRKDIATVGAPFGRDYVQVYAFETLSPDLKQLVGARFSLESPKKRIFDRLISDKSLSKGRASIELVTVENP